MIWVALRWLLHDLPVWLAFAVSLIVIPRRQHNSFWERRWACSYGLHDMRWAFEPWIYECTRCGKRVIGEGG